MFVPDMRNKTIMENSVIYHATDINTSRKWTWQSWIPDFHVMDDWMRPIHEGIGCVAYQIL